MSYLALATARFEEMRAFYEHALGGEPLQAWDRPGARGVLLDVTGLKIELLDAAREGMALGAPAGRTHLVRIIHEQHGSGRSRLPISASLVLDDSHGVAFVLAP